MDKWYRTSLVCGLVPLCTGFLIFGTWRFTKIEWLEDAGAINIFAGIFLVSIGILCLGIYSYKARKAKIQGYLKRSVASLLILIVNFPVAAIMISAAVHAESESNLILDNQSDYKITQFFLSDGVGDYPVGSILPKQKIKKEFHFKQEGSIYYSFNLNGEKYDGIMFGYVTPSMGFSSKMTISETEEVSTQEF